ALARIPELPRQQRHHLSGAGWWGAAVGVFDRPRPRRPGRDREILVGPTPATVVEHIPLEHILSRRDDRAVDGDGLHLTRRAGEVNPAGSAAGAVGAAAGRGVAPRAVFQLRMPGPARQPEQRAVTVAGAGPHGPRGAPVLAAGERP